MTTAAANYGSLNYDTPQPPAVVPYMDLGGGLNTRLDPHALARNELAISINIWPSYDNAISKRPGSKRFPGSSVGSGQPGIALVEGRFGGNTYAIKLDTARNVWARNCDTTD